LDLSTRQNKKGVSDKKFKGRVETKTCITTGLFVKEENTTAGGRDVLAKKKKKGEKKRKKSTENPYTC